MSIVKLQTLACLRLHKLASVFTVKLQAVDRTEVRFANFLSGGFIIAIVVNLLESKVTKCISLHCTALHFFHNWNNISRV